MGGSEILRVEDLHTSFFLPIGELQAVRGVSFSLKRGRSLGIVGESGSGKTVLARSIMRLNTGSNVETSGSAFFDGRDLLALPLREMRRLWGAEIAMIFQDPMTPLNPLLTVERQLTEVLQVHRRLARREARGKAAEALGDVGIPNPEARLDAWPHELSGGMRERVMIAMALLLEPAVLLADEPTTALDVTIQAQILGLMAALQERRGTAIVLITHDLGVVAGMADRVHVMYAGRLVETAATGPLFSAPRHPYTEGLLASVPSFSGDPEARLTSIEGQPPDLADLPAGCAFAPRCRYVVESCRVATPPLAALEGEPSRATACTESQRLGESVHEEAGS